MAYRRRHGIGKFATFKEEIDRLPPESITAVKDRSPPARSLTSPSSFRESPAFDQPRSKNFTTEPKGLWGVIAQKAKSVIEDDKSSDSSTASQSRFSYLSDEGFKKMDNPKLRRGLDKLTSSLNQIGDTFEKAFEDGRTLVENKTADIIQETRKLQTRRRGTGGEDENQNQSYGVSSSWKKSPEQPMQLNHMEHETQLKASRDVAMATAAKAKLLLRELKTVKADLAFAKERCAQLEEENKHLRENHREKGSNPADEDLIRLQLESLLAEKARLAHENSVYARENRFLREIVEYHQLTMQDVVYIDEGSEEVTQVYPLVSTLMTSSPAERPQSPSQEMIKEILVVAEESSVCANVVSAS
ncbi:hypothetical protein ISN45_Aa06g000070 [Arabidopsis thaliana x Arabidopsis arenosa]|uniref:Uncharacterized protein n=1 Tax=Arabidopsis thaliana x Arabidopsis arenosa TaxID=1240361 RepID=A0A8T1YRL6_9BRAS|nr:hypothetical protein ISN45_Aa06g000070 [Arabidopsis thaliana x Arabidopsis arenosa]